MFAFLLIVQTIVAAAMVAVILMQRSEGGGLGVGGSPTGLMSARGAADFLTRATAILAALFVILSIVLAGLATVQQAPTQIDPATVQQGAPAAPGSSPLNLPAGGTADPLAGAAAAAGTVPSNQAAPAPAPANGTDPLSR
jgi:preprotein translocase subunit SecG